jgi:hypothetical protein
MTNYALLMIYMLTNQFELLVAFSVCVLFISLVSFGLYCRYRYNSYEGTGRAYDIDGWYDRANITWIFTFCLSVAMVIKFI